MQTISVQFLLQKLRSFLINKRINRKMKKIPTLFENYKKVGILPNVAGGMEWVLLGEGI